MNGMFDLNTLWFLLVGVLFTGYVILDGFDLGVGALYLFARNLQRQFSSLHADRRASLVHRSERNTQKVRVG